MPITTICNAKIGLSHVYVYLSCLSCPSHILWRRAALQRLRLHQLFERFWTSTACSQWSEYTSYESYVISWSFDSFFFTRFHNAQVRPPVERAYRHLGHRATWLKLWDVTFCPQLRSGWMDVNILNMINHRKTIQTEFPTMSLAYVVYI